MVESVKRTKSIKIRLTGEEHEKLLELKTNNELATWIRNTCLNIGEVQQLKKDPQLLKEINKIGVNMNQIARAINSHQLTDQIAITQLLSQISDQLDEVLKRL